LGLSLVPGQAFLLRSMLHEKNHKKETVKGDDELLDEQVMINIMIIFMRT
jgi:hypothetical protein